MWSLTDLVAFSRDTQGGCSIVESISAARENARGAREVTSTEIWECLNTTYNALAERERAAKRLGPARVPVVRRGPRRDVRRTGRLDAVPRRRLPVHGAGPRDRTRRHDGAAAAVPGRRQRVLAGVGDGAALRGCARHLPAHLSRRARRGPRRRVHAAGPAVPALGLLLAATGRAQPRRTAPPGAQPGRRHRGGPAAAGPGAQRAGVPSPGRAAGVARAAPRRPAEDLQRRRRSVGAGVLPLRAVGGVDGCRPQRLAGHRGR